MSDFISIPLGAVIAYLLYREAAKFITGVVNKHRDAKLQNSLNYLVAVGALSKTVEVDEDTGQSGVRYRIVDQQLFIAPMLKTKPNIGFIREQ